uniref:Small ribosomal subunit Rsm22 n=1 Tax=Gracilinema caldarium TaxID=215591 RepID=A0A7C3EEN8_9SPIR
MPELAPWERRLIQEWRTLQGRNKRKARGSSALPPDRLTLAELDRAGADLLALQRGLTGDRHLIGSAYMDESRRLGAYLLFYWFTSYTQTWGMLDIALGALKAQGLKPLDAREITPAFQAGDAGSMREAPPREIPTFRILDLGSGPAPCGLAVADWFNRAFQSRTSKQHNLGSPTEFEITACDQSSLALEVAEKLARSAAYRLTRVGPWQAGTDPIPKGSYHCIVMGHLLNELWQDEPDRLEKRAAFIGALGDRLEAGGIMIILEPALLGTGRDLLKTRDRLLQSPLGSPWYVLAPCFTQGLCPAVAQTNQTCHSDFVWHLPRTVRELERRTGLDKDLVKTTALVLARSKDLHHAVLSDTPGIPRPASNVYRVVSEPMLNKAGRTRVILCGKDGRIPLSARLGEAFPAEAMFKKLRRSDAIFLHQPEQRETGLALGPETRINYV